MKEQRFFGEQLIFFSFNERDKVTRLLAFVWDCKREGFLSSKVKSESQFDFANVNIMWKSF